MITCKEAASLPLKRHYWTHEFKQQLSGASDKSRRLLAQERCRPAAATDAGDVPPNKEMSMGIRRR
jgi:hypothetical protein